MTLTPGTRFGHYEISGSLGKGGMGEVWRARDTELGCDVAIKVLPATFMLISQATGFAPIPTASRVTTFLFRAFA